MFYFTCDRSLKLGKWPSWRTDSTASAYRAQAGPSGFQEQRTRAVLSPGNRAKPCKFRYVKSVRNFMWKWCYRKDRAMRPIRGCPENFRGSLTTPTATIPRIFHGLLFRSTLWMFLQNLKSVALPVPQIIGGTQKNWEATGYAHAPYAPNFLWAFIPIGPVNVIAKFEIRSFTRSRDNKGYPINLDSPWIRPRSIFSRIFNGLLFGMAM